MRVGPKGLGMARRRAASDDDETVEEDADDDEEENEPPRRRRSHPPAKRRTRGRPRPIRRWSKASGGTDEEEGEEEDEERPPVFWRARDSLYFGPLVALAIVVVLISSLFAFTQNWPPLYVVESNSMQHGSSDVLGLINTGDLVLAQKLPTSSIQTYVEGAQNGYSTYGEPGDVLLYRPNGGGATPIIHRAIIYLEWDAQVRGYNAIGLPAHPCGLEPGAVYSTPGTPSDCGTTGLTSTLDLFNVGWTGANLSVDLRSAGLGAHSGFITMGDNNTACSPSGGCTGFFDQGSFSLSQLVEPDWVIGVARGMIPWFGALKLWIEQSSTVGEVPSQSWQFLGLSIAGLVALAFGLHFALRVEGIEDPRRRAEEEEDEAEDRSHPSESRARRFLHTIRPWGRDSDEDSDEEDDDRPASRGRHPKAKPPTRLHHGRPKPRIRRGSKSKARGVDEEEDL
jgi:signal peptidase I